jgi:hypothetical protein
MRVVAGLAAFFLLGGVPAVAQYAPPTPSTGATSFACFTDVAPLDHHKHKTAPPKTECKTTVVLVPACPLNMHVRQGIGGGMIAVDDDGVKRKVFAPRLWLFLNDLSKDKPGQKIVSASVTVHGTSGKAHMQSLESHPPGYLDLNSNDLARTLDVDLAEGGEPGVSGDFRLPGFTSATRIDLDSVTYDDGTTWKLTGTQTCRVAPDMLMRVSN